MINSHCSNYLEEFDGVNFYVFRIGEFTHQQTKWEKSKLYISKREIIIEEL